jgi:enoyl-CoA hydratase
VTTETEPVLIDRPENGVVVVRINRPEARNALNMATRKALAAVFEGLHDDPSVRAIVLTGNEQTFAAGADLKEFIDAGAVEMLQRRSERYWNTLARTPQPVIAAINGYALGGGLELAMCCDVIIAGESAQLGQPEVRVGIMPGAVATQLARLPPLALMQIKEAILAGQDASLEAGLMLERKAFQLLFASADKRKACSLLREEAAQFQGRVSLEALISRDAEHVPQPCHRVWRLGLSGSPDRQAAGRRRRRRACRRASPRARVIPDRVPYRRDDRDGVRRRLGGGVGGRGDGRLRGRDQPGWPLPGAEQGNV